jgi:hypothetical protein
VLAVGAAAIVVVVGASDATSSGAAAGWADAAEPSVAHQPTTPSSAITTVRPAAIQPNWLWNGRLEGTFPGVGQLLDLL